MEPRITAIEAHLTCPVCAVDIPATIADTPDRNGLTVTFDTDLLDEHMAMHAQCTCQWGSVGRVHNPTCTAHAA
jgi:hypothetical protein